MRFRFAAGTLLALSLSGGIARAAEPTPTELAVGRRLFEEATELEGRSEWRAAREKLEQAISIKETPGLRFHLGYCSEQVGKYVTALVEYDRAVDLITSGQKAPDVERSLGPARERVKAKIAKLTLHLPSEVTAPKVRVDGNEVAPTLVGRAAPVDPGRHRIEVEAIDYETAVVDVELVPGESRVVNLALSRKAGATPPPPSQAMTAGSKPEPARNSAAPPSAARTPELDSSGIATKHVVLISEGTLALAGVAVGVGFLIARGGAEDRVNSAQSTLDAASGQNESVCSGSQRPAACDDLQRAIDDYDRAGTFSTVGFVAGGVGAAAALLTYLAWPTENAQAVVVQPASAGLGFSARGQF